MTQFLNVLFPCSLAMSAVVLLLALATPALAKRYESRVLYRAWGIAALGLAFPFRPHVTLPFAPATVYAPVFKAEGAAAAVGAVFPHATVPAPAPLPWAQVVFVVWLLGAAAVLGYCLLKHLHFLRLMKRWGRPVTDAPTTALLQALQAELGFHRPVALVCCPFIESPLSIGFFRPVILLPQGAFAPPELALFLKHELVHAKRGDLWCKCLVLFAVAIHWFNPTVYLLSRMISVQCEISCDAAVLAGAGGESRLQYATALIGAVGKSRTVFSTHFSGGKNSIKRRVYSIMDTRVRKAGAICVILALAVTLLAGTAFAAAPASAAQNGAYAPQLKSDETREESLARVLAPFAAYGLLYDAEQSAVFYGGERVRAFVDLREGGLDGDARYSFSVGYFDDVPESTLCLKTVRDASGAVTGIEAMPDEMANELLDESESSVLPSIPALKRPYVFDATTTLSDGDITATDRNLEIPAEVERWAEQNTGAGLWQTTSGDRLNAWFCHNSGNRLAWRMERDGDTLRLYLYSDVSEVLSGPTVIHYQAPASCGTLEVFLDEAALVVGKV